MAAEKEDKIKKIARYYLFYGTNEYLLKQKISSLIKTAVSPGAEAFDLDKFDGKRCEAADLLNSISTAPVASPLRVTILENTEKLPAKTQGLIFDLLPKIPEYSVLAMTAEKADRRSKLFKTLLEEKKKVAYEFEDFTHADAVGLVARFAADRKKKIDSHLADAVVGIYGTEPFRLENEVEKLALLVGEREAIEKRDLSFATGFSKIETAYELPELALDGKIKDALELCGRAISSGMSEMQILYIVKNHLDRLNTARNAKEFKDLMSIYRLPYPAAVKIFQQSKRLGQNAILSCIKHVFRAEYALKSARFPSEIVIELLILAIYLAAAGNKTQGRMYNS